MDVSGCVDARGCMGVRGRMDVQDGVEVRGCMQSKNEVRDCGRLAFDVNDSREAVWRSKM